MTKHEEIYLKILRGKSDANIGFDDLCHLLRRLGFEERSRGSHHIFRKPGVRELINLQHDKSKAKGLSSAPSSAASVKIRARGS